MSKDDIRYMNHEPLQVRLTGVDIPFWRLVGLFLKCALAALPAIVLVTFFVLLAITAFAGVFGLGAYLLKSFEIQII
jgi:hypothetical protein